MCSICDHANKTACYCPRCPQYKANTEPCSVCATVGCTDSYCTKVEHFEQAGSVFCQLCVEEKHEFEFIYWQLGMYCDKHKATHLANRLPAHLRCK